MEINEIFGEYQGYRFVDGNKPLPNLNNLINLEKEKWNTEDLALVHSTNLFPDKFILNNLEGNKVFSDKIMINGEEKTYSISHPRKTVHFSLNGKVGKNDGGSWNYNFIIIEPLKKHIDEVVNLHDGDTYIDKSVELSDEAVFLISKDAFDKMDETKIKGKNIIVFSGNQEVVVNEVLISMGYSPQTINNIGWTKIRGDVNRDKISNFLEYLNKRKEMNPELTTNIHTSSYFGIMEEKLVAVLRILSAVRNGKTTDLKHQTLLTIEDILSMYKHFISKDMSHNAMHSGVPTGVKLDDSLDNFNKFISEFNIDINNNGNYFIKSVNEWYDKNYKNNIFNNNHVEQLYSQLKQYEIVKNEKKAQEEQLAKDKKINEIIEKISKLSLKTAYKMCDELQEYSNEIRSIINSMKRFKAPGAGNSIVVDGSSINFHVGEEEFYDFVSSIPNVRCKSDELCILDNVIDENITVLEAQQVVNYYGNLYQQFLLQKNQETRGFGKGFVKIEYIIIMIIIVLLSILLFVCL